MRLRPLLPAFPMQRCMAFFHPGFPGSRVDMVHDQIDIPLCENLKAGAFRQNHPEHRVCLLQSALLPALHRVTVINAGTLYSVYTGLQSIRVTKSEPRSVRIYSNTEANSKVPIRFSRRSKQDGQRLSCIGSSERRGRASLW